MYNNYKTMQNKDKQTVESKKSAAIDSFRSKSWTKI